MESLAVQGPKAAFAAASLQRYLANDNWDLRVEAALVLGFLGDRDAVASLRKVLTNQEDWRLVAAAANSLGRLRAKEAKADLKRVSEEHWYPPVREAASQALRLLANGSKAETETTREEVQAAFSAFEAMPEVFTGLDAGDVEALGLPIAQWPDQQVEVRFPGDKDDSPLAKEQGVKVPHGYIVGFGRGKGWRGSISFMGEKSKDLVTDREPEAIYKTEGGIIAVTGLSMASSPVARMEALKFYGLVYRIERTKGDGWVARKWRTIPGIMVQSRLLKDDRLFLSSSAGLFFLSPNGTMKMVSKKEAFGSKEAEIAAAAPRPIVTVALLERYPIGYDYGKLRTELKLKSFQSTSDWLSTGDERDDIKLPEGTLVLRTTRDFPGLSGRTLKERPYLEPPPTPEQMERGKILEALRKIRAARLATTSNLTVPTPKKIPSDLDENGRRIYLTAYTGGYRSAMAGVEGPAHEGETQFRGGYKYTPSGLQGYADGQAQALKNHPEEVEAKRKEYESLVKKDE
ncbi:hypothetical protein BH09VER1_BH09VER1_44120 [soil metagenome]